MRWHVRFAGARRASSGAPPALTPLTRWLERVGVVSVHDGARWLALGPPHWAWYLPILKNWLMAQPRDALDKAGLYTPALIDMLTIPRVSNLLALAVEVMVRRLSTPERLCVLPRMTHGTHSGAERTRSPSPTHWSVRSITSARR